VRVVGIYFLAHGLLILLIRLPDLAQRGIGLVGGLVAFVGIGRGVFLSRILLGPC
jgi:hypothetical protein